MPNIKFVEQERMIDFLTIDFLLLLPFCINNNNRLSQSNLVELTDTQSRLREYEEQLHEQEQQHERHLSEQQETFEAKIEELLKEKTRINRQKMQIEQSLQLEMNNVTRKHQSEIEKLKKRV